jgi:hypothetical protein
MPDEIVPMVGARTGAEILAYENDEDDLLVTVLWNRPALSNVRAAVRAQQAAHPLFIDHLALTAQPLRHLRHAIEGRARVLLIQQSQQMQVPLTLAAG